MRLSSPITNRKRRARGEISVSRSFRLSSRPTFISICFSSISFCNNPIQFCNSSFRSSKYRPNSAANWRSNRKKNSALGDTSGVRGKCLSHRYPCHNHQAMRSKGLKGERYCSDRTQFDPFDLDYLKDEEYPWTLIRARRALHWRQDYFEQTIVSFLCLLLSLALIDNDLPDRISQWLCFLTRSHLRFVDDVKTNDQDGAKPLFPPLSSSSFFFSHYVICTREREREREKLQWYWSSIHQYDQKRKEEMTTECKMRTRERERESGRAIFSPSFACVMSSFT